MEALGGGSLIPRSCEHRRKVIFIDTLIHDMHRSIRSFVSRGVKVDSRKRQLVIRRTVCVRNRIPFGVPPTRWIGRVVGAIFFRGRFVVCGTPLRDLGRGRPCSSGRVLAVVPSSKGIPGWPPCAAPAAVCSLCARVAAVSWRCVCVCVCVCVCRVVSSAVRGGLLLAAWKRGLGWPPLPHPPPPPRPPPPPS